MASSGLVGPFNLCVEGIDVAVRLRSPGVFALGNLDHMNRFQMNRVGRAGEDLRSSLRQLIGSDNLFKFAYTCNGQEAFEKECELFHRFRPGGNFFHPVRPEHTHWLCPFCKNER